MGKGNITLARLRKKKKKTNKQTEARALLPNFAPFSEK